MPPLQSRIVLLLLFSSTCFLASAASTLTITAASPATPAQLQLAVVDRFLASLTAPVNALLSETAGTLATAFTQSTSTLSADDLFTKGSYAQNFNETRVGIVSTLESIRLKNQRLRERARLDLRDTMQSLRSLHAVPAIKADADEYEHDVIRMAYIYEQYERGYRFVHREYRADVQCNYALMYHRGLHAENLTDTADTAHVSYLNIVQKVERINVANRRDIEEQTEILLRNVAKSMRLLGRVMGSGGGEKRH